MTEGDQPIETHDAEQRQTRRALAALVSFVRALAAIGAAAASWQLHKAEYDDSQANLRRFDRRPGSVRATVCVKPRWSVGLRRAECSDGSRIRFRAMT